MVACRRSQGKDIIAKLSAKVKPAQENKVIVSGYTDNTPVGGALERQSVTSNQKLSQKRADAAAQFLISQGMKPDMVSAQGLGEADPAASNDSPRGQAKNRHVPSGAVRQRPRAVRSRIDGSA